MNCPSCDSPRVYPSRLRHLLETFRHRITDTQPYRCHQCSWRGWRPIPVMEPHPDVQPEDLRTGRPTSPVGGTDLDPLDPLN